MVEELFTNIYFIIGSIILACFGGYIAYRVSKKERLANAASDFRSSIDLDVFAELHGHTLVNALTKVFPSHKKAAHEFRIHLGVFRRLRFNRAWKSYHGGYEECPGFLVLYGVPDNGNEILIRNLKSLLRIASQT